MNLQMDAQRVKVANLPGFRFPLPVALIHSPRTTMGRDNKSSIENFQRPTGAAPVIGDRNGVSARQEHRYVRGNGTRVPCVAIGRCSARHTASAKLKLP